jgi:hypothetical protein
MRICAVVTNDYLCDCARARSQSNVCSRRKRVWRIGFFGRLTAILSRPSRVRARGKSFGGADFQRLSRPSLDLHLLSPRREEDGPAEDLVGDLSTILSSEILESSQRCHQEETTSAYHPHRTSETTDELNVPRALLLLVAVGARVNKMERGHQYILRLVRLQPQGRSYGVEAWTEHTTTCVKHFSEFSSTPHVLRRHSVSVLDPPVADKVLTSALYAGSFFDFHV